MIFLTWVLHYCLAIVNLHLCCQLCLTVGTGEKGIGKDTDQAIYLPKFSSDFFVSFKNLSFQ